jgi:hypothetical protein
MAVSHRRQGLEVMHPDTLAALRLLASALAAQPDDLTALAIYGNIPEHLADALDDHAGDDD